VYAEMPQAAHTAITTTSQSNVSEQQYSYRLNLCTTELHEEAIEGEYVF
jgi:hypothetical protein